MPESNPPPTMPAPDPGAVQRMKDRFKLGFGLFAIFFVFYVGAAVIQTPAFRTISEIPFLGMPFGLFLSLAIFPVSWIIIAVFFAKWK